MTKYLIPYMLISALLIGCRGETPKRMPDTLPDVRGRITNISQSDNQATTVIQVAAVEGVESESPQASVIVDDDTLIEDAEGATLSLNNLQAGLEVEVWVKEEIMESSPVQSQAAAIRVSQDSGNDI
ncbi:DUF3221 domain-containing protein [Pontibacter silvestris]|uniref:DUF3221 domain-containing protein n=1 Tax=Pontibacter silvestris TaxID=2305183 RepID=A0ABW4WS92_9BACT|nr:DUF3221 domain-containing protein [Pontibacter silvestris]MCC9138560.1 YobA family protein [Pontibacter silvestris]